MSEIEDLTAEFHEFGEEVNKNLAKVVDNLRQVSSWASEAGPVIDQHGQALGEHTERLETDSELLGGLRDDVNAILKELRRRAKYQPINWPTLTSEDAAEIWLELGEWVSAELVDVYSASRGELLDCWPLHPAAVRHLSWLYTAHLTAYDQAAGASAAAEWNVRWHGDALAKVQSSIRADAATRGLNSCNLGLHFDEQLPGAASVPPPVSQQPPRIPVAPQGGPYPPPPVPPGGQGGGWGPRPPFEPVPGSPPVPVPPGGQPSSPNYQQDDPKAALAKREFWWPQLMRARAVDVAAREEAERLAQEEAENSGTN